MFKKITLPRKLSRTEFIALIAALMALNALAIDIMLPALPSMGEALGISRENDRQLVLSSYMLGFGISQIFFGPISDRFGRRAPLFIGLVFYIAAAFAAIVAPSFGVLLFMRLVQGLGAAGTRVIAASVVRDCYSGRAMAEIMSLVFMVFMIIPIIAPGIGQLLLMTGPWWTIFLFMGFLGTLITLWGFFRLPETLDVANRRPLTVSSVAKGFSIVFTNRVAINYAFAGTFMFGALLGYIYSAQQVYVEIYDFGKFFPIAFGLTAMAMAFSSYLNSKVVGRFGMRRITHFALLLFTTVGILFVALSSYGALPFWLFYLLVSSEMFLFSWIVSNANSLSMEPLGAVAGTASGVFGFIQTVGGALLGLIAGQLFDGTLIPLSGSFVLMGVCAIICVLIAEKGKLFGTENKQI